MVTKSGMIKKSPQYDYKNINKKGIIGINLKEDDELIEVHVSEACRQGNEGTHHRQHAAEEHSLQAILVKPVLSDVHMALLHEEILAILIHEAAAALMPHGIGKDRTHDAAHHAGNHSTRKGHIPGKNQETCEAQDQLAGNRDAGVLSRHQHRHCHIAPISNELQEHPGKTLHNSSIVLSLTHQLS